jgi:hypothetical protein
LASSGIVCDGAFPEPSAVFNKRATPTTSSRISQQRDRCRAPSQQAAASSNIEK